MEQARVKGMLESLQAQDPEIEQIVTFSKFVVAYLLQQEGQNSGWRKANIEGPVYLVRRRVAPRFQLLVKNQNSQNDLLDDLHQDWEVDCQQHYIFYKVEDPSKRIRGLWFHEDSERSKMEQALEYTLEEIRNSPASAEPQTEPQPGPKAPAPGLPTPPAASAVPGGPGAGGPPRPGGALAAAGAAPAGGSVTISMPSLRSALHSLSEDETFLRLVMQKLEGAGRSSSV